RRKGGGQAPEHRIGGALGRRAVSAGRQFSRKVDPPAHRSPDRCRRIADRAAASGPRVHRGAEHRPLLRWAHTPDGPTHPSLSRRAGGGGARACEHPRASLTAPPDTKPPNALVSVDGEVKLLGFGIAKLLDPDDQWGGS